MAQSIEGTVKSRKFCEIETVHHLDGCKLRHQCSIYNVKYEERKIDLILHTTGSVACDNRNCLVNHSRKNVTHTEVKRVKWSKYFEKKRRKIPQFRDSNIL